MEKKEEKPRKNEEEEEEEAGQRHQPPYISGMEPVQREAYGGGLYGKEEGQPNRPTGNPPASSTQSADGPDEATTKSPHLPLVIVTLISPVKPTFSKISFRQDED